MGHLCVRVFVYVGWAFACRAWCCRWSVNAMRFKSRLLRTGPIEDDKDKHHNSFPLGLVQVHVTLGGILRDVVFSFHSAASFRVTEPAGSSMSNFVTNVTSNVYYVHIRSEDFLLNSNWQSVKRTNFAFYLRFFGFPCPTAETIPHEINRLVRAQQWLISFRRIRTLLPSLRITSENLIFGWFPRIISEAKIRASDYSSTRHLLVYLISF